MKNADVDVFIISYNRLSYLRSIVEWLEKAGFENIHIVDNASTYLPLLEYLSSSKHQIHRLNENYGHLAVWKCGKFKDVIDNKKYIVTDCDILPVEQCPLNVTEYFENILEEYPGVTKVGFALKVDDLPQQNASKEAVLDWEKQFWERKIGEGLFDASIDTTFALYRPGVYPENKKWWKSIRTDFPYIARHLPWYADTAHPTKEDIFYQNSIQNEDSFWSVTDLESLKKYNKELLAELEMIYASRKWKILQFVYKFCNTFVSNGRFRAKIGKKNTPPSEKLESVQELQKYNKQLVVELGSIKSSGGWKLLQNISDYFSKTNHK